MDKLQVVMSDPVLKEFSQQILRYSFAGGTIGGIASVLLLLSFQFGKDFTKGLIKFLGPNRRSRSKSQ